MRPRISAVLVIYGLFLMRRNHFFRQYLTNLQNTSTTFSLFLVDQNTTTYDGAFRNYCNRCILPLSLQVQSQPTVVAAQLVGLRSASEKFLKAGSEAVVKKAPDCMVPPPHPRHSSQALRHSPKRRLQREKEGGSPRSTRSQTSSLSQNGGRW